MSRLNAVVLWKKSHYAILSNIPSMQHYVRFTCFTAFALGAKTRESLGAFCDCSELQ